MHPWLEEHSWTSCSRLIRFTEQKARFLSELDLFIDMSALEQQVQLSGRLPTVEEYSRRRMGSSAVGVCVAITE